MRREGEEVRENIEFALKKMNENFGHTLTHTHTSSFSIKIIKSSIEMLFKTT